MNPFVSLALGLAVLAQGERKSEVELKELLVPYYVRQASEYELYLDAAHSQRLELVARPVLTWTNAEAYMGAVFVWTYGGRPELIGCIGSHQYKPASSNLFHEFHSLSETPLPAMKLGGRGKEWRSKRAGVEMIDLAGAGPPADNDRARLTQLRNLAREFHGFMKDNDDVTELRLLPQPLFRYQAADRDVIDGAIFAEVWKGTDPEILLLLQARQTAAGEQWQYALARFNYRAMWVERNDKEIWRVRVAAEEDNYITGVIGERTHANIQAALNGN